jgi:16S rRNA (uracil1498-N3)-methyltransferase
MITVSAHPGAIVVGEQVLVSGPEGHHLMVRRVEDMVELRVVDGAGTVGWGRLGLRGKLAAVTIERVERVPAPAPMVLAVGAGDRERFVDLVEKAVELGVTRVVPLDTAHSLSVANRLRAKHREKLERRAQEAIKQSGNPWLPEISDPVPLERFLAGELPSHRWLADLAGGPPGPVAPDGGVTVAVGPEGGFTAGERSALLAAGFTPAKLGPHVLRFDTAALAALTMAWQARQRNRHD